mmetsp:Transcript_18702/g.41622  ORF Transcript_18702/g.41622 Transcript_18702/m.41622 type:complete len:114 (+) Transcript_18702:711-1052(+)
MSISTRRNFHLDADSSKLLVVPPECHEHAKELKAECLLFAEKTKAFKEITRKISADMIKAGEAVEHDKMRAIGLRLRASDGEGDRNTRREDLERKVRDREMVLRRLAAKLEAL